MKLCKKACHSKSSLLAFGWFLHDHVLGIGVLALQLLLAGLHGARVGHRLGLFEGICLTRWMQVRSAATFDALVVALGQDQEEKFVPIGPHLVDDGGEVAKPRKDLLANGRVLLADSLLQFLSIALG